MTDHRATDLVIKVAAQHGHHLLPHVAQDIAQSVLTHTDDTCTARQLIPREAWELIDYRVHIRRDMVMGILYECLQHESVPVTLPVESLRYLAEPAWWAADGREVPAEAVAQGVDYETVEITITVPVRKVES